MLVNDACVWEDCFALEKVNNLQRNFQFQHTLGLVDAMISEEPPKIVNIWPCMQEEFVDLNGLAIL